MLIVPHKQETKQIVLHLFKKGLTANQVAVEANRLCRGKLNTLLTKNAVMGIKNRAGMCIPNNREYVYPQRRNTYYDKSLAFNEKIERVPYEQKVKARLIAALR
jgi:hypothetical protein|tara:strand:- start:464 stop:775 length:312 start_codon:yes stop_codon:yes gene_type:complete